MIGSLRRPVALAAVGQDEIPHLALDVPLNDGEALGGASEG